MLQVLQEIGAAGSAEEALGIGNALLSAGVFAHVTRDHDLKDEPLFYRFASDDSAFHGG